MPCVVKECNNDRIIDGSCTSVCFHMVVKDTQQILCHVYSYTLACFYMVVKDGRGIVKTCKRCSTAYIYMVVKDDRKEFSKIDC